MSIYRQSLTKFSLTMPSIESTLFRSFRPPCVICPEELNFREDDENGSKDGEKGSFEKANVTDDDENLDLWNILPNF